MSTAVDTDLTRCARCGEELNTVEWLFWPCLAEGEHREAGQ